MGPPAGQDDLPKPQGAGPSAFIASPKDRAPSGHRLQLQMSFVMGVVLPLRVALLLPDGSRASAPSARLHDVEVRRQFSAMIWRCRVTLRRHDRIRGLIPHVDARESMAFTGWLRPLQQDPA